MTGALRVVSLTALSYLIAGLLGQLFAMPPGYATIIWPASGIALGAAIAFGPVAIYGVLIGSFLTNVLISYLNYAQWVVTVPLLIACGSALQTLVSYWLIKRVIGPAVQFFQLRHVVWFVVLGGPVGCLISASFGTLVLHQFGLLQSHDWLLNWMSWWIGDTVGVLVVVPWLAVLFPKQFDVYFDHPKRVVSALFFVAFATVILSALVAKFEHNKQQQAFQDNAQLMFNSMSERIKNSVDILYGVKGLIRGSSQVTVEDFYAYAESVMVRDRAIQALSLNYVVSGNELEKFQKDMTELYGGREFVAVERNLDGQLSPVTPRERHILVGMIYPYANNERAIGYDVYSQRDRRHTLNEAIRLNAATPTPVIDLVQGNKGILLFLPVYRDGKLLAMATGMFDIDVMTASTLSQGVSENTQIYLVDRRTDNAPYILAASHNAHMSIAQLLEVIENDVSKVSLYRKLIPVGASSWELVHIAPNYFVDQPWSTQFTVAGGMFLSGLLGWVFILVFSHTAQIEQQVVARTRALSFANRSLRESEGRLKTAIAEAEEANMAKSRFLANMSHEIRTPLNGLLGSLLLLQEKSLSSEQQSLVAMAQQSGDSLLDLINDILDLSKIEAGELQLEPHHFLIQDLLEDVATLMRPRALDKRIGLVAPSTMLPEVQVWGDRLRIRQILVNLIGNAIKFTSEGQVNVSTEYEMVTNDAIQLRVVIQDTGIGISEEAQKRLFQRFKQADGSTTRQYGGTGLGLAISKELAEAMGGSIGFESEQNVGSRFWFAITLDCQPAPKLLISEEVNKHGAILLSGLGMDEPYVCAILRGLSIPNRIMNTLGDAIDANNEHHTPVLILEAGYLTDSQLQALSTYRGGIVLVVERAIDLKRFSGFAFSVVYRPVHRRALLEALNDASMRRFGVIEAADEVVEQELKFMGRVLLVEDNATNQLVAKGVLSLLGVEVDVAANGQEALDKVQHSAYDLIFMDCQMPIMDGYEATKRIRQLSAESLTPANVPIVALSANAMKGDDTACIAVGMNDHVAKPISKPRLEQVLRKWLFNSSNTKK